MIKFFLRKLEEKGISQSELWRTWKLIPNWISYVRIVLSPLPMVLLLVGSDNVVARWWTTMLFVALALSDGLDGLIARKFNMKSEWGKIVDPIGDKLLVAFTLVAMLWVFWDDKLGMWLCITVWLILAREVILTAQIRVAQKIVTSPTWLGKSKTAVQMLWIAFWLVPIAWWDWVLPMWIAAVITVTLASWWQYYERFVYPARSLRIHRDPW